MGFYHIRVKYPGDEESGEGSKVREKSAVEPEQIGATSNGSRK